MVQGDKKGIPSKVLKKSLDNVLVVLGMSLTDKIFEDMWRSGIVFGRNKSYSVEQISQYFEQRLGKHAAELLMKQLRKQLHVQFRKQMRKQIRKR